MSVTPEEKPKPPTPRPPTPLGRKLLEKRERRGWSHETLKEESGVSMGMISQLETGKRGPRVGWEIALKFAKAFGDPDDEWIELARLSRHPHLAAEKPDFHTVVSENKDLDDHQKAILIAAYDGFASRRGRHRRSSQPEE